MAYYKYGDRETLSLEKEGVISYPASDNSSMYNRDNGTTKFFVSVTNLTALTYDASKKHIRIQFDQSKKFGGKTYYLKQYEVSKVNASTDCAGGTITLSVDGQAFVDFAQEDYWVNSNRTTSTVKELSKGEFYSSYGPKDFSSSSNILKLQFSVPKEVDGKAYIDSLYFNLYYGFKALYSSPEAGSSSGSFSGDATSHITNILDGSVTKSLTFTTKDGYKITGWKVNGVENTSLKSTITINSDKCTTSTISAVLDGTTTYQPIVEKVQYKIVLNANAAGTGTDGTIYKNDVSQNKKTHTVSYTVSTSSSDLDFSTYSAKKNFYTFTGWKYGSTTTKELKLTASNLISGTGAGGTEAENTRTYYAQYTPTSYTYTLNGKLNVDSVENFQNSITAQKSFPKPNDRVGYTFQFWIDADTGEKYNSNDLVPVSESYKVFTAIFTQDSYSITFKEEEGSWANGDNSHVSNVLMDDSRGAISLNLPIKPGYYTYWKIERDGAETTYLTPEETLNHKIEINSETKLIGNRTYTAMYEKISYEIKYSGYSDPNNGGDKRSLKLSQTPGAPYSKVEENQSLNTEMFIPGYEFLGWVSNELEEKIPNKENPKIIIVPSDNPYAEQTDPDTKNPYREYIAYFKPINYKVEFKYDSPAEESGSAKITPSYAPNNGKEFFRLDPDGGGYPTMTVEDVFTSKLIEPRAKGYTFKYWNIYVDNKKITTSQNIVPQIMSNNSGDKILGTYTYEAIYDPIVYTLSYDVIDGIHRDYLNNENTKLRSSYKTNKDRSLMKLEDDTTDVSIYRPGYEFTGFSMNGGVTKTRSSSVDYVLPANVYAENLTFNLSFAPYTTTVRAIPKLFYKGEFTLDFPIFEDEENNGIPWIVFKDEDENISTNSISITYYDDITVRRQLVFDEKRYVFKGWQYPGKKETDTLVEGERDTSIVVNPITEEGSLEENTYYAIFEYVDYSVSIYPYCNGLLTSGKYGSVLVGGQNEASYIVSEIDDVVLPSGIEPLKNSVKYQNNAYTISNLHYRDTIELAMMPYATNDNARYHFDYWDANKKINNIIDRSTLLKLTVNQETWIEGTQKNLYPQFTKIPYVNTISTELEDSQTLYNLFNKTISGFILINAITTLGSYGFLGCSFLEYAFLPGTKTIQQGSFQDCTQLKTAILSSEENLAGSIGVNTFKNCSNLNTLILPTYRINLNDLFSSEDLGENKELWSLFRKGMGRIYVPEEHLSWYMAEGTNWFTYANIIRPIRTNGPIYKEPIPIPDEGEVEE